MGKVNKETGIKAAIREAVVATGKCVIWNNPVGFDFEKKIKYGLGKGSADLVGFLYGSGRLFAIEVKTPEGKLSKEQRAWLAFVNKNGGYACSARSCDDALRHLEIACSSKITSEPDSSSSPSTPQTAMEHARVAEKAARQWVSTQEQKMASKTPRPRSPKRSTGTKKDTT